MDSSVDLGVVGRIKAYDTLDKNGALEALESIEGGIADSTATFLNRSNARFFIGVLKSKVKGHWKELSTESGRVLIREDMRFLKHLLSDPVKSKALKAPGATEEERLLHARFEVVEEDFLIPDDEYLTRTVEDLLAAKSDENLDMFRHSAKKLAGRLEARAALLTKLASELRNV